VGDRLVEHRAQALLVDLGHRVPAEALLAHAVEFLGERPAAAQADLHDVAAEQHAFLDGPRERLPVVGQRAVLVDLAGVGVRVEVDDAEAVGAVVGSVIEWSPPITAGIAPAARISPTRAWIDACAARTSLAGESASP
jgi:hypothetical protein